MKRLTGLLGRGLSFCLFYGPASLRRGLAGFLAFLWYDLFRIRREVVLDNLTIAFPQMSPGEKIKLGRRNLRHLALCFVEYCYMPWLSRDNFDHYFEFHNDELLAQALKRGNGVLLLTAHLGNGGFGLRRLVVARVPHGDGFEIFQAQMVE